MQTGHTSSSICYCRVNVLTDSGALKVPSLSRGPRGPRCREGSSTRCSHRKRRRPEEVVAKFRQADEVVAERTPIAEVARSLRVSEATLRRWRTRYGAVAGTRFAG
jgi:hypothetical protein